MNLYFYNYLTNRMSTAPIQKQSVTFEKQRRNRETLMPTAKNQNCGVEASLMVPAAGIKAAPQTALQQ